MATKKNKVEMPNLGNAAARPVDEKIAKARKDAADSDTQRWLKARTEALKKLGLTEEQIQTKLQAEYLQKRKEALAEQRKAERENLEYLSKYSSDLGERISASMSTAMRNASDYAVNTVNAAYQRAQKSVGEAAGILSQYQSAISARIQGSGNTFQKIYELIRKNLSASQYVTQTKVLEKLSTLVDAGIAYNVEQRSFLEAVKDDIATTFSAANGTLLRLIRIQQSDSTAARLGMEAMLTQFLNATFQDTSYLKDSFDTVSEALIDLSASMSASQAAELEFITQKWLGSMAAVGVSSTTLSTIAKGIAALGTGGVEELAGNTSLQSLLVLAGNRRGIGYGNLLTGGLDANTLEDILRGIVEYAQTFSDNSNKVILNQYAKIFGLSVSDIYALRNLDISTLETISNANMTYADMLGEVNNQLRQLPNRLHISQRIDNLVDNVLMTIGGGLANNPALYVSYILNDLVEAATGGINIPFVSALGTGVDVNANVNQLVKVGLLGFSMLSSAGTIFSGLLGGTPSLSRWKAEDVTRRGGGFYTGSSPVTRTVSESTYIGQESASDIKSQTIASAKEEALWESGEETDEDSKQLPKRVGTIEQLLTEIKSTLNSIAALEGASANNPEATGIYSSQKLPATNNGSVESSDNVTTGESKTIGIQRIIDLLESVIYGDSLKVSNQSTDIGITYQNGRY